MNKVVKKKQEKIHLTEPRKSIREKKSVKEPMIFSEIIVKKKKAKRYKCGKCEKKFPPIYGIRDGIRSALKKPSKFLCKKCTKKLNQLKNRRIYQRKKRFKKPEYHCDICGIIKHEKFDMSIHMEKHQNLKCNVCLTGHASRYSLINHLKSHFTNHCCHYGGLVINNIHTFRMHIRIHENRFKKPKGKDQECHKCEHCGKNIIGSSNLTYHVKTQHRDGAAGSYICKKCLKVFADRELFRGHSLEHNDGKLYPCEFEGCKKIFLRARNLRIHKQVHSEEPKFQCPDCGKKFFQHPPLFKHKKFACKAKKPKLSEEEQKRIEIIARDQLAQIEVKKYTHDSTLMKKLSRQKNPNDDINEIPNAASESEWIAEEADRKDFQTFSEPEDQEDEVERAFEVKIPVKLKIDSNDIEFVNIYIKEEANDEDEIKEEVLHMEVETETVTEIYNDACVIKVEPIEPIVEIYEKHQTNK